MSFELIIKCSQDIDNIHIDFSDGTSMVTSRPKITKEKKSKDYLNTDEESNNISQDVIKLPQIKQLNRSVKIAPELQNIDIAPDDRHVYESTASTSSECTAIGRRIRATTGEGHTKHVICNSNAIGNILRLNDNKVKYFTI